jgi:hypothetical protein
LDAARNRGVRDRNDVEALFAEALFVGEAIVQQAAEGEAKIVTV